MDSSKLKTICEMRILTDNDRMPFGKFKDERMIDIPASYYHYLWTNGMKNEAGTNPVANYIARSLSALREEYKDGIWN